MITVSEGWKATHKEKLLPETFIEITYIVTEPGLQDEAAVSASDEEVFSDVSTLTSMLNKSPERYPTLESNLWLLDGSYGTFDGTPEDPGYVTSIISNGEGEYTSPPTITLSFEEVHTALIPGLTITWSSNYEEYPKKYRLTAHNGSDIVAQTTIDDNNSVVSYVVVDIENYTDIEIEVLEWCLPGRRARAIEIFMGIENVYTKDDLINFTHTQTVDILSATLPKNEIKFSMRNEDSRWNPDNPTGAEKYLLEQQEMSVRYGMRVDGEIEWIDGGRFWLSGWETPANGLEATFTARDSLQFMNEVYTGAKSGTLFDIATAAFTQANLPLLDDGSVRYVVDAQLSNYSTEFTEDYTIAEVLQMVAHSGVCVLYQDRNGVVHLETRDTTQSDYTVGKDVSYKHPEFEITKPLKAVSVSYGESQTETISAGSAGEVQTVSNPLIITQADAQRVGAAAKSVLEGRKTISGEFRADPRMDALDVINVQSKYAENAVTVTEITYSTTGGAMRGKYKGRIDA